jgi:hypothetical protein
MVYSFEKYTKAFILDNPVINHNITESFIRIWSVKYWSKLPENKGLLPSITKYKRYIELLQIIIKNNGLTGIDFNEFNEDDNDDDEDEDPDEYLTKEEWSKIYNTSTQTPLPAP